MSRRHVWREIMQRRAHTCVETLAKLRVDLSERTHAASVPPVATASDEPQNSTAKASHSGLYEAIKLEQWMKEDRRELEAKAEAEVKALDDQIAAIRMKTRRIEYETKVAKVRSPCTGLQPRAASASCNSSMCAIISIIGIACAEAPRAVSTLRPCGGTRAWHGAWIVSVRWRHDDSITACHQHQTLKPDPPQRRWPHFQADTCPPSHKRTHAEPHHTDALCCCPEPEHAYMHRIVLF